MTDMGLKVVFGALLHDIGKVIYRQGDDKRKHSRSGYDFLREEVGIEDESVLQSVLYHHADLLKNAKINKDSLAYITYIADNIASSADRRKNASEDTGFEIAMPLQSVFNILNGNHQKMYYRPGTLSEKEDINYPGEEKIKFDEYFYSGIKENIKDCLKGLDWNEDYVNSLLQVMEANLSYVPSSTARDEMADISLFDHLKLTAAIASCIYEYLGEKETEDYEEVLFHKASVFYEEEAFILFSMDISGIQDFIYTITSKNALKTLRARSFYLEIMMEHIIDCLLQELGLSRANLIYSGGGHCYILMPNTKKAVATVVQYEREVNEWLLGQFKTSLYVAGGFSTCSANTLKNIPEGSYSQIYKNISEQIGKRKGNRYMAGQIIALNTQKYDAYTRECAVCRGVGKVNGKGICPVCDAIENFSKNILYDDFFVVTLEKKEGALPLPKGYYLIAENRETLMRRMEQDDYFVRAYGKNKMYTGKCVATKLWVGDYTTGKTFSEYAKEAEGVGRVGILRADVDNLGHAFVAGFESRENQSRYVTLSRTATLSRQLSLFFKYHINRILEMPGYGFDGKPEKPRNATICYSGGDDLFIVGAWNEMIELAVDIADAFGKYTQGTLTLSAGVGIYDAGYPISVSAVETAGLEEKSKNRVGKNAITLLCDGNTHKETGTKKDIDDGTYSWEEFKNHVIGDKYRIIRDFLDNSEDRGMNFMYHLLELIRNQKDRINFARYVYLLSRMEPGKEASGEQKAFYQKFSRSMYEWVKKEQDCRQMKTAMNLYSYLRRVKEDE